MGWQGFVAVDGVAYNWMGGAPGPANVKQVCLEYTSTKSIFTFDVDGKVTLTVTFLSPVYPDDMARQSLQFSYVSVKAQASDGQAHRVQVYMDVSGGRWLSAPSSIRHFHRSSAQLLLMMMRRVGQRRQFSDHPVGHRLVRRHRVPQVLPRNPATVCRGERGCQLGELVSCHLL